MGACGLDSYDTGKGPMVGFCEHGNEPLVAINCWGFLEWLSSYWILKKGPAPWSYLAVVTMVTASGGTMLQAGRSRVRFPMRLLDFQLT
jgi:hypothetical protein